MKHGNRIESVAAVAIVFCTLFFAQSQMCAIAQPPNEARHGIVALREFHRVDCQSVETLPSDDLLLLTSKFGFAHYRESGSPLLASVPAELAGLKPIPGIDPQVFKQTIIVQNIPTATTTFKRLEGGFWGIFFDAEENDFTLHIDNALDHAVRITIASHDPITISSKSQLSVGLEDGTHQFKVYNANSNTLIDGFTLTTAGMKKSMGDSDKWKCIYNVLGVNRYTIKHAKYESKK